MLLLAVAKVVTSVLTFLSATLLALLGVVEGGLLVVLAIGCTLLPFSLSLVALRQMSAFAVQMAVNLEPVYSIVLAILIGCVIGLKAVS